MPDIAVAASPAAAAKSAPAAGNAANAATDGQSSTPFAAVLQRQMENPAPARATVADAAAIVAAPTDPVSAGEDIATLLPMLMGSAMLASTATETAGGPISKKPATDEADTDAASTLPVIALPALATAPAVMPADNTASAADTGAANSGLSAAGTANLAATPDLSAAAAKPDVKSSENFQPLLADNRDVRAAGLSVGTAHNAPVAAPTTVSHTVGTAVGQHGWDSEVGNHMVWMSNSQASRAELVLTPPQMGKIEISLNMSGDQATATFVSANPAVRDAIESALPRLREILADAGVTLGQTQVGSEAPRQWAGDGENKDNSFRSSTGAPGGIGAQPTAGGAVSWTRSGLGLVDVFA